MKKMLFYTFLTVMAGSLAVAPAAAQIQWTPAQKAIWKTETTIGDLVVKGDIPGALSYFDDNFQNWGFKSPIPVPKDTWAKNFEYYMSQDYKPVHYSAVPLTIWVQDNYAYVNYYSAFVFEDKTGKKTMDRGRNLDVFLKKGEKWLMVASMTMDAPGDK